MYKKKDEKDMGIVPGLAHVFPLLVRVVTEPWEDLTSLLSRTAVQMGYKKVNWLLRPEDCSYSRLEPNVCFLGGDTSEGMHFLGKEEALFFQNGERA